MKRITASLKWMLLTWKWGAKTWRIGFFFRRELKPAGWVLFIAFLAGAVWLATRIPSITRDAIALLGTPSAELNQDSRARMLLVTFYFGAFAALSKYKWQKLYGLGEIGFATYSGWQLLGSQLVRDVTTNLILLAGVGYLMARGVSNMLEALVKEHQLTKTSANLEENEGLTRAGASR